MSNAIWIAIAIILAVAYCAGGSSSEHVSREPKSATILTGHGWRRPRPAVHTPARSVLTSRPAEVFEQPLPVVTDAMLERVRWGAIMETTFKPHEVVAWGPQEVMPLRSRYGTWTAAWHELRRVKREQEGRR